MPALWRVPAPWRDSPPRAGAGRSASISSATKASRGGSWRWRGRWGDASAAPLPGGILGADAIRHDYATLPGLRPDPAGRVLVVGNLPYSVGTAILSALLTAGPAIARLAPMEMVLMLQREVAERVAAGPGSRTYGSLSVLSQMAADVVVAFAVPPEAFRPLPQVDSAVIHLRLRTAPRVPVADLERFSEVVRAAFSQRRKKLANALGSGLRLRVDS